MTKQKKEYLRYLESAHWRNLRKAAFKRDGHQCVRCGSVRMLRGHHKRYRKNLRLCTVDDIETLCQNCHEDLHRTRSKERKQKRLFKGRNARLVRLLCQFDAYTIPLLGVNYE